MLLLKAGSDTKWRFRNMTVLHIALENGVETTRCLLDALEVSSDRNRGTRYQYTDMEGTSYTVREYVQGCMPGLSPDDRQELLQCLAENGL